MQSITFSVDFLNQLIYETVLSITVLSLRQQTDEKGKKIKKTQQTILILPWISAQKLQ